MSIRLHFPLFSLKPLLSVVLALAVAFGLSAPRPAAARDAASTLGGAIALGIIGTAAYCAANPRACGARGSTTRGGGARGPVDAIGLDRAQSMMVQEGLQNTGFYTGAIDGAIGAGTRASIRQYQSAVGDSSTGALTGRQINDLVALSPSFVGAAGDPIYMFNADLAGDLDRDGVRELQAALNASGYNAGPVDGAFGGKTRDAIAAYKSVNGLPGGPVGTRRLLAHINGWPAPEPAGLAFAAMRPSATPGGGNTMTVSTSGRIGGTTALAPTQPVAVPTAAAPAPTQPVAMPAPTQPVVALAPTQPVVVPSAPELVPSQPVALPSAVAPPSDVTFDLVGVSLGMSEAEVVQVLSAELGSNLLTESVAALAFGGSGALTQAMLAVQPDWPTPPAEQMLALFDEARPELGAVALFRFIHMPDGVDQTVFEAQILPDIVAKYGEESRVSGSQTWVGSAAERGTEQGIGDCGALRVGPIAPATSAEQALWASGGGVTLDAASLDTVAADCGDVLNVVYDGSVIRIGLWNSAALSTEVIAPAIKF